MTSVNLIPVPRLIARRRATVLRRWAWASGVYAACLAGAYGGVAAAWDYDRGGLQRTVDIESKGNNDRRARRQELDLGYERSRAMLEANRAVGQQPDWSILLRLLAKQAANSIVLRDCQVQPLAEPVVVAPGKKELTPVSNADVQPARYMVKMRAMAKDLGAVSAFAVRLRECALFEKVDVMESKREPFMAGEAVSFRLECLLTGAERPK